MIETTTVAYSKALILLGLPSHLNRLDLDDTPPEHICAPDSIAHRVVRVQDFETLGLPFTHKPQQDNITHHPSVNTRHSYTETRYSPAIVIGAPGVDHFFDPDSPLLRRPEALHHRVALEASTLFF